MNDESKLVSSFSFGFDFVHYVSKMVEIWLLLGSLAATLVSHYSVFAFLVGCRDLHLVKLSSLLQTLHARYSLAVFHVAGTDCTS